MQKFTIKDWYGKEHQMTADEFHERILKDAKRSNYNWLSSAYQIYEVCSLSEFPEELAIEIKVAILNCFSNILNNHDSIGAWKDEETVYTIYNKLYDCERIDVILARQKFLTAAINFAVYTAFELPVHGGPVYGRFCQHFKGKMYKKYIDARDLEFKTMISKVRSDFVESVKSAEAQGVFKEEDKKNMDQMIENLKRFMQ